MKTYKIFTKLVLLLLASTIFTACSNDEQDVTKIEIPDYLLTFNNGVKSISIVINKELELRVLVTPGNAYDKGLRFEMEGSDVASVSQNGIIRPIAIGTDRLTISTLNGSGLSVSYPVHILGIKVETMELLSAAKNVEIELGSSYMFSDKLNFTPKNVSDTRVSYESSDESILTVNEQGEITPLTLGTATVTITTLDGSNKSAVSNVTVVDKLLGDVDYNRKDWGVTVAPFDLPVEGGNNKPECIIDGDISTFLALVKPGIEFQGINVPADAEMYFIIDMKKEQSVDYVRYEHRNTYATLRFYAFNILGSNDGKEFAMVQKNVVLPGALKGGDDTIDSGNVYIKGSTFRYYKIVFTDWNTGIGVGQFREFYLGRTIAED